MGGWRHCPATFPSQHTLLVLDTFAAPACLPHQRESCQAVAIVVTLSCFLSGLVRATRIVILVACAPAFLSGGRWSGGPCCSVPGIPKRKTTCLHGCFRLRAWSLSCRFRLLAMLPRRRPSASWVRRNWHSVLLDVGDTDWPAWRCWLLPWIPVAFSTRRTSHTNVLSANGGHARRDLAIAVTLS